MFYQDPQMMMYQRRLQQMQYPTNSFLKCRYVASQDEAKAAPTEMDGTPNLLYCPAECTVYVKYLDLNGMPVLDIFKRTQEQPKENIIAVLEQRIAALEKRLEGVKINAQSDANYTHDADQPKSDDASAATVR